MRIGKVSFNEPSGMVIHVVLQLNPYDKIDCLKQFVRIASHIDGTFAANHREVIMAVLERERLGTTGVGNGAAIPHAKLHVSGDIFPFVLMGTLLRPIEFDSIDEKLVDIVALVLGSENAGAAHLKKLARVSRLLISEKFRTDLRSVHNIEECGAVFDAAGQKPSEIKAYEF